jgi:hypothetical protein
MYYKNTNIAPGGRAAPRFTPVPLRVRHDGWTPDTQAEFIGALAQCACVDEACRRVGKSPSSAYALRQRAGAHSFRAAWEAALDYGVSRLTDAAFSRSVHGVENPVFFQGEQIGVRRHFDERLTMFIMRYRDPVRYGKWLDGQCFEQNQEGPAAMLNLRQNQLLDDGMTEEFRRARVRSGAAPAAAQDDAMPAEVEEEEGDVP